MARTQTPEDAPAQPQGWPEPDLNHKHPGGDMLTEDETWLILSTTLRPHQLDDPVLVRWILKYCQCREVAQASREVGIRNDRGYKLRTTPEVHAAIEAITAKAVMKFGYDATEVVERVKEIAGIDPIEFENPDGSYKTSLSQISPEARRAIRKFKVKNIYEKDPNGMPRVVGQLIDVELYDKQKGLELLGREKSLFKETRKVEHDVTENMASLLLESKQRAETRQVGPIIEVKGESTDEG